MDSLKGAGQPQGDEGRQKETQGAEGEKKKEMNGHAEKKHAPEKKHGGEKGKSSGVDLPDPKKAADIGNAAGKQADVGKVKDVAGGAKGAVSGVTGLG